MYSRRPVSVAQATARVRAAVDDLGPVAIIGEVVQVSRLRSKAVRAVVVDQGDTRTVVQAHIGLDKGRWAKRDLTGGPATCNLVKVGQVLHLQGSPQHDTTGPSWTFQVSKVMWVADEGPIERRRLTELAAWYGDAGVHSGALTYAKVEDIAEVGLDPQRVKVLTARWSDGHKDFAKTLGKSAKYVLGQANENVIDVPVQGERMVDVVCRRLGEFTKDDGDIVFIVRGGGGWSDLRDYDSPRLAEAIRDCRLPVATAIGHTADKHLADHAADFAFYTPTYAAEWLTKVRNRAFYRRNEQEEARVAASAPRQPTSASNVGEPLAKTCWQTSGPTPVPALHQASAPPPSTRASGYPASPRVSRSRSRSPQVDWVSIAGFIAAFTGIGPAALILGITGLYRTRRGQLRGRGAAVIATILGAISTISLLILFGLN